MAQIITRGYLINVVDYELFDQIITFINEFGNIFSCMALGVRKILSKNARHLKFGTLLEFDFFMGKTIDKIGKLKKVVSLDNNSNLFNNNSALLIINQLFFKAKPMGEKFYKFYLNILNLIKEGINQNIIIIKILIEFLLLSGISLRMDGCAICNSKKIVNFSEKEMGLVCSEHNFDKLNIASNVIKIIYFIYKDKLNLLQGYSEFDKILTIKFLMYLTNSYLGINLYNLLLY